MFSHRKYDNSSQRVASYDFDQNSALGDLMTRAERLKRQHEQAVDARRASMTRRVQDAGREVNACKTQLQEYVFTTTHRAR